MTDLLLLAAVLAFFATAVALVRFCEWIIGPDDADAVALPTPVEPAARELVEV